MNWNEQQYRLGVAEMDDTHQEFIALLNAVKSASDEDLVERFRALAEHTQAHFDNESRLMRECRFFATPQHEGEHRRVLAEAARFLAAAENGQFQLAREYVEHGLPDWFRQHLATMDAALAACLKQAAGGAQ